MKNTGYFKNKNITIVGLARSGVACANLLFDLGAKVSVTDILDNKVTRANALRLKSKQIRLELGCHTRDFFRGKDFIVVSPGVPGGSLPFIWAKKFSIPLMSEIEVAYILCPAPIIAVTGSSGKTTVSTLIAKMIESNGTHAIACGNIGNPFCGEVSRVKHADYVVLEVSSFQLETIINFQPKIAVILNISKNHLDRYNNMQEYINAKMRIFMNQDALDYLFLNSADQKLKQIAMESKSQIKYFSSGSGLNPNQAVVAAIGRILGIEDKKIMRVFKDFKGIEHRMESVAEVKGVKFINDSKATTADSCIWALGNINQPVILICGGKDKGVDYAEIIGYAKDKVRLAVLIGEAKQKIKEALEENLSLEEASSLPDAVKKAFAKAKKGDCILLSPMCSSFDMFSSYEERGRVFKETVLSLAKNYN